ncbi:MAG: RagB/SusD family nutrient uptake outer membrane protein [Bacteroidales bacterium]|nr:RagB/SusD family nutrient uptake outer membrane protein [Bacteroidales bacterium]
MQSYILDDLGLSDVGGSTTDGGEWFEVVYSGITSTSAHTGPWFPAYKAISQCNMLLGNLDKMTLTETEKKWVKGQALFIRAKTYFVLVQLYSGVPLHVKEVKSEAEAAKPRASEREVYDQIVADLEEAQTLLPSKYADNLINGKQYAINQTCDALLSRVYLTMAGNPLNLGTEYYTKARDKSLSVINSNTYQLLDNFAHLFDLKHENSSESIIELDFIQVDEQGTAMPCFMAPRNSTLAVNTWGTMRLRKKFVKEWRMATCENGFNITNNGDGSTSITEIPGEEDYRYQTSLISEYTNKSGAKVTCFPKIGWQANDKHSNYAFLSKYCDPNGVSQNGHGNNVILMRFAEIYLIFAEAQNEIAGPVTEYQGLSPLAALNKLRERARKANGVQRTFPKKSKRNF